MRTFSIFSLALLVAGGLTCGSLMADSVLPSGDTLQIVFDPVTGALDGVPGATVGWGFAITWTSNNNDWVSFTSSSIGGETNPSVLNQTHGASGPLQDYLGSQGFPAGQDLGLSPTFGPWTEAYDPVNQLGIGSVQIAGSATPGSVDDGQIVFSFDIYNGDPLTDILGDIAPIATGDTLSVGYSVTVDSATPEPSSWVLLLGGIGFLLCWHARSLKLLRHW